MKRRVLISGGLAGGMVLLLALAFTFQSPAQAGQPAQGPSVRVVRAGLGQQAVTVAVAAEAMTNLGGFEFDLAVDPAVARFQGAQVGDFLGSTGRTVGALGPLMGSEGESLAFGAYSYDPSGQQRAGPSGDGVVATMNLSVVGAGVTTLTLSNPLFVDINADVIPVTATGAALQVRPLHAGWNLLASCVDTAGLGVTRTLESLAGAYDRVLGETGTYVVGLPDASQSLHEVSPPWAYYVRAQSSDTVTLTQVSALFDPATPIPLRTGWRWVGYCGGGALPVSVALQSIAGQYDMVLGERDTYAVGLPDVFQSLREMRPGAGYLIRMTADGVLQYPSGAVGLAEPREGPSAPPPSCSHVQVSPYLTVAYGEAYVDGAPAPVGTVVEAVTPRGEVAGCFAVHTAGYFGLMHLYGADETGQTPGFRAGEEVRWRVNGQEALAGSELLWSGKQKLHHVTLTTGAAPSRPVFLPVIMK